MKTKYWILILAVTVLLCGIAAALLFLSAPATHAQIISNGEVLRTVDLKVDQEFTVHNGEEYNIVTVRDGKIAVTEATCPDEYCMRRGWCSGGMQIVCLPNSLIIRFTADTEIDGVSG